MLFIGGSDFYCFSRKPEEMSMYTDKQMQYALPMCKVLSRTET